METNQNTNEFNHEAGLKLIYEMIESVKNEIGRNYFFYLLWGYLVIAASLLDYVLFAVMHKPYHYIGWPILMSVGFLISVIYSISQNKLSKTKTYIGTFMRYLWIAWCISLVILLSFILSKGNYTFIIPVTMAMYGMAIFISGSIVKFRPLIYGGIIAWIASIIAFLVCYENQLLIEAVTILISYLIPGYILKNKSKNQL